MNPDFSKVRFQMIRISKGWASGFQIAFKIQTICNTTFFRLFEMVVFQIFTVYSLKISFHLKSQAEIYSAKNSNIFFPLNTIHLLEFFHQKVVYLVDAYQFLQSRRNRVSHKLAKPSYQLILQGESIQTSLLSIQINKNENIM